MYILMHVFIYIQIHVYVCTMFGVNNFDDYILLQRIAFWLPDLLNQS